MVDVDAQFMNLAIEEAHLSLQAGLLPVGAVIVHNGSVVARGHKEGLMNKRLDHAELMALRQLLTLHENAQGMTLYTTLEPCLMCFGTAANAKVRRIVFALEDSYGGIGGAKTCLESQGYKRGLPDLKEGIGRMQALSLFQRFFSTTTDPFWRDENNPLVKTARSAIS